MDIKILFVDDEEQILKAIKRLFIDEEYQILTADSAAKALDILSNEKVDLIVSDIRMPQMDGFELFEHVKVRYPFIPRIALSGYADSEKIINAINSNLVKLYLVKPWDNTKFLQLIHSIITQELILKDKKVLAVINNFKSLPSIPKVYTDVINLINNNADIEDIAKKIEHDQAITLKILHICNSAIYNVKTTSISKAITFLGLNTVKYITLTSGIFNSFKIPSDTLNGMWHQTNLSNKISSIIFKDILNINAKETYTLAGLVYNVGALIMHEKYEDTYQKIDVVLKQNKSLDISDLEKSLFGLTHQEIGAYLLKWWDMPQDIIEAALYHHDPLQPDVINKELVSVIHLANYYSCKLLNHEEYVNLNLEVFNYLGIKKEDCDKIMDELKINLDKELNQ